MARIKQDVASLVTAKTLEEHFKTDAIVDVFAGMQLKTKVNPLLFIHVEERLPTLRQFVKGRLDQSGRPLRPGINVRPCEGTGERDMRLQPEIPRGTGREPKLLERPALASRRVSPKRRRREAVERLVIGGMDCNQLSLQMRGEFRDLNAIGLQNSFDFIAILPTLRRLLEVKEPGVPSGNLHPFVAKRRGPTRNLIEVVEWRSIPGKLGKENCRAFDGSHMALQTRMKV